MKETAKKGMTVTKVLIAAAAALAVILAALVLYDQFGIRSKKTVMPEENLTRVEAPEQTEAMEHEAFIKEEYVSVLPQGENIAPLGKIEASSFTDVYVPNKAVDGKTNGPSYWEAAKDSYPNLLTLSLHEPSSIHAVRLCLCPLKIWGKRTQEFSVRVSADGETYEELFPGQAYEFDPDRGNEVVLEFDARQAAYVQLEFYSNTGAEGAQVAELEVYTDK